MPQNPAKTCILHHYPSIPGWQNPRDEAHECTRKLSGRTWLTISGESSGACSEIAVSAMVLLLIRDFRRGDQARVAMIHPSIDASPCERQGFSSSTGWTARSLASAISLIMANQVPSSFIGRFSFHEALRAGCLDSQKGGYEAFVRTSSGNSRLVS